MANWPSTPHEIQYHIIDLLPDEKDVLLAALWGLGKSSHGYIRNRLFQKTTIISVDKATFLQNHTHLKNIIREITLDCGDFSHGHPREARVVQDRPEMLAMVTALVPGTRIERVIFHRFCLNTYPESLETKLGYAMDCLMRALAAVPLGHLVLDRCMLSAAQLEFHLRHFNQGFRSLTLVDLPASHWLPDSELNRDPGVYTVPVRADRLVLNRCPSSVADFTLWGSGSSIQEIIVHDLSAASHASSFNLKSLVERPELRIFEFRVCRGWGWMKNAIAELRPVLSFVALERLTLSTESGWRNCDSISWEAERGRWTVICSEQSKSVAGVRSGKIITTSMRISVGEEEHMSIWGRIDRWQTAVEKRVSTRVFQDTIFLPSETTDLKIDVDVVTCD